MAKANFIRTTLVQLLATLMLLAAQQGLAQSTGATIAIFGGTFINDALLLRDDLLGEPFTVETKLGESAPIYPGEANGVPFYYIDMHGSEEPTAP